MNFRIQRVLVTAIASTTFAGCGVVFPTNAPPADGVPGAVFELAGQRFRVETVVSGLEVPWALGFTPDGSALFVTERPGRLNLIDLASGQTLHSQVIPTVSPPFIRSEQGLMGLAVAPNYADDPLVYVSYTVGAPIGQTNVIERYRVTNEGFVAADAAPVVPGLPASFIHDGLALRFGPDGKLYASTGEATERDRAQDLAFLGGKFLRMQPDGSVPDDNPFGDSLVWSLGHRNPQGFDFHPERPDVLLSTEHGPSFPIDGNGGLDEVNRIRAGGNYGWPLLRGDETADGFDPPIYHSGVDAIAPAGATFCTGRRYPAWSNAFLFVGLRGASLWVGQLNEDADSFTSLARGLENEFGRLRAIAEGPDGYIYISTSNRDGRGTPVAGDDRVLRLDPVE